MTDSVNRPKDKPTSNYKAGLKDAEEEIDELQSKIYELEGLLENFRGYMVDIATDYVNNCPESYIVFAQKKMEEMKDES